MRVFKAIGDAFRPRSQGYIIQQATDVPLTTISVGAALRCPPVAVAVRVISHQIGALDWRSADPRVNDALRAPNGFQTKSTFIAGIVRTLLVHGKCPVQLVAPIGTRSTRFYLALHNPDQVRLIQGSGAITPIWAVGEAEFEPGTLRVIFDGGSFDPEVQSRVMACSDSIRIMNLANQRIANLLTNGAEGRTVVSYQSRDETELKKEQMRLVSRLAPQRADESDADYTARTYGGVLLTGPNSTVTHLPSVTPADQELLALRESALREISSAFGLPPFSAGGSGDVKYSNVGARQAVFLGETIQPLVGIIREGLGALVGSEVFADVEGIPPDFASKVSAAVQAAGGAVMTPDEVRRIVFGSFTPPISNELRENNMSDAQANANPDRRGENSPPPLSLVTEE